MKVCRNIVIALSAADGKKQFWLKALMNANPHCRQYVGYLYSGRKVRHNQGCKGVKYQRTTGYFGDAHACCLNCTHHLREGDSEGTIWSLTGRHRLWRHIARPVIWNNRALKKMDTIFPRVKRGFKDETSFHSLVKNNSKRIFLCQTQATS